MAKHSILVLELEARASRKAKHSILVLKLEARSRKTSTMGTCLFLNQGKTRCCWSHSLPLAFHARTESLLSVYFISCNLEDVHNYYFHLRVFVFFYRKKFLFEHLTNLKEIC